MFVIFSALLHTACGKNSLIVTEKESGCFGLGAADFETIQPDHLEEEGQASRTKSHANPSWFKAGPG